MWFGESEKIVKRIFENYRDQSEKREHEPILLFNEADAIFSKRRDTKNSSTDQTENAIQNILLQEMEDLSGILIATTNLETNFDKAFERRFLYKIRFEVPSAEARAEIWKSKLPELPVNTIRLLAERWILTGGQIDNISRKFLMNHVLTARIAGIDEIGEWIREEIMGAERKRIGY
jgi:SpoVK/Ycf46/Vps4 family AAA+-type ATPase